MAYRPSVPVVAAVTALRTVRIGSTSSVGTPSIGLGLPSTLAERRLLISPKRPPQHVAHFTQRGVSAYTFENERHQVLVGASRAAQRLQGRLHAGVITCAAKLGQLVALPVSHGLVDDQNFDGPFLSA